MGTEYDFSDIWEEIESPNEEEETTEEASAETIEAAINRVCDDVDETIKALSEIEIDEIVDLF